MKALILAGGKATRLYPMTLYMPKQLIMINGRPVISYIINHCRLAGITEFVICISDSPLKEHFYNALGDGANLGVKIEYSVVPESFGTAGRILYARELIGNNTFLIYYGDIITTFDLKSMIDFHIEAAKKQGSRCTLAISSLKTVEFGSALYNKRTAKLIAFKEKPKISEISDFMINCGIAVCDHSVVDYCSRKADFFKNSVPKMLKDGVFVSCYDIKESFCDIGSFSAIGKVLKTFKNKQSSRLMKENKTKSQAILIGLK